MKTEIVEHHKRAYQLAEIPNMHNKYKYGFIVSEPKKYFSTLAVINIGMIIYYVFTATQGKWYLTMLSAIFHVLTNIFFAALAFVDPGIVPKIFDRYESAELGRIPIS